MTVGEIRWVDLPPSGGHAQRGRRPAIIAQSQVFSGRIPTVLVIPLTSQLDALRFPGTVLVEADVHSLRSRRQHKAWGGAQRNPRKRVQGD